VKHLSAHRLGVVSAPAGMAFAEATYGVFNLWAVLDRTRSG
jgi:hypothetical protein